MDKRIGITVGIIAAVAVIVILVVVGMVWYHNHQEKRREAENQLLEFLQNEKTHHNSKYVSEQEDGLYLVNERVNNGRPLYGPAKEIYIENQERFARVKCMDDTWAIIDCSTGQIDLQGCSKILELPLITVTGAAMRDGKVVIFSLPAGEFPFSIEGEVYGFTDVQEVINNSYVMVKKDTKYGVLYVYDGSEAIPPEYEYIDYKIVDSGRHKTYFICRKSKFSIPKIYSFPKR